jgi:hypothetical protein
MKKEYMELCDCFFEPLRSWFPIVHRSISLRTRMVDVLDGLDPELRVILLSHPKEHCKKSNNHFSLFEHMT